MSSPKSPVFSLTDHPKACPRTTNSSISTKIIACPGVLTDVPRKSGLGEEDGRWKQMCSVHGMIYYNLSEKANG